MIYFSQLEKIVGGKILSIFEDRPVENLIIDSRKVLVSSGSLFFAIQGERNNGHDFIPALYKIGIRQFVVERKDSTRDFTDVNTLVVSSSVDALQNLVAFYRKNFNLPVIGITGSNGKTIVKEWLYQLLSKDYNIVKNPGSYNSQVGVPLSVWQIQAHHQLGIFEAGISRRGEMEKLEAVIRPTIGIFTTIGTAHDEGFLSEENKIEEKLKLFSQVAVLIYCSDYQKLNKAVVHAGIPALSWAYTEKADIQVSKNDNQYELRFASGSYKLTLPFNDHASVENALHGIVLMVHLHYSQEQIQERINNLRSIPMRLELKEGINQCQVIDDTYNNDLGGLQISLDFLLNQQQKKNKRLILSDIEQSGLPEDNLIKKIAALVDTSRIQKFIGIGPALFKHRTEFKVPSEFYETTEDFLGHFQPTHFQNEIILIKGARNYQFEKIVTRLQRKVHGTVMEIDLGAMIHNLNFFKSRLKPATKIMAMVKAFAYGSGSNEIASLLQYHHVDYLGVAYADEGSDLRKNNILLPIMVMNPSEESFQTIIANDLEPEVYNFKILKALLNFLQGKSCKIHIKVDTGMHRLGFEKDDVEELINILNSSPQLRVASIFSHLAGADEKQHDEFSKQQGQQFLIMAERISTAIGYKPLFHLLNSPGILRLPELQFDMVRLGIGLYGVDPTADRFYQLKPVATLKTIISQIKHLKAGESIGYGRQGRATKDMTVGTIAIGYADGFSRAFSKGVGEVLVKNARSKVIGNVCMDMTMIDLTGIEAHEGDEVIIFGKNLSINEVASKINTIAYEILTNTSERVKRIFVAESI